MSTIINTLRYKSFDIELIRYRNSDQRGIKTFTEKIFGLLLKLKETKCLFILDKHKTRQIKLQFQKNSKAKRNKYVKNCLRSDQKKIKNVYKGNSFFIYKNEKKRRVYFSGCETTKTIETLTSAVLPAK